LSALHLYELLGVVGCASLAILMLVVYALFW